MTFGTETPAPVTPPVEVPVTPTPTELPADVQKKIENQDAFIEKLKAEAKERDEQMIKLLEKQADKLDNSETTVELLALLEKFKNPETPPETPPVKEVSTDEIVEAATNKIKQEQLDAKRAANMLAATNAAEKAYGEDFNDKIAEIAVAKSMSMEAVNDMARNYPQAFNELFLPSVEVPKPDTSGGASAGGDAGLGGSGAPAKVRFTQMSAKDRAAHMQNLMKAKLAELEN